MTRQHGPWQIVRTLPVYRDPWLEVDRDEVIRPDGDPGTHCVVRMKAGVCVLARDSDGDVYLTEEFHYAVGRTTLEGVSGGIEPGEEALATAQRELQEELGLAAANWHELGVVDPFTSIVLSPTRLYLAEELRPVDRAPEGTELIRSVKLPLERAVEMVIQGQITHSPTCVLLLLVDRMGR